MSWFPPSSESPASPVVTFSLPLPPPLPKPDINSAPPPQSPISPSASPSVGPHNGLDPPWASQSPARPWCDDPLAPPLASKPWTSPQPFSPSAPPWLHAPCSLVSTIDCHPTGSTGLPHPSDIALVLPGDSWPSPSIPSAPPGSTFSPILWLHRAPPSHQQCHPGCSSPWLSLGLHLPRLYLYRSDLWIHPCSALHRFRCGSLSCQVWLALWCFTSPTPLLPSPSLFPLNASTPAISL